jgi:hypothetical protein
LIATGTEKLVKNRVSRFEEKNPQRNLDAAIYKLYAKSIFPVRS